MKATDRRFLDAGGFAASARNDGMGNGQGVDVVENGVQNEQALPDGWVWTTIGECARAITGTTPSKKDPSNFGNYLPFVKPPQLKDSLVSEADDELSAKGAKLARVLPPQSVLVSCIGILGKTGINSVPVAFNQQINAIVFPSEIEPRYGFYYMQSAGAKSWLHKVASATTVTIVNKSKFQRTPFPLAPFPEQRRIVAAIETQFTRLDAGMVALERARASLKRYRAAVLKAACEGRLVPTEAALARAEGRAYEPADQLLIRILAERCAKWEAAHPGKRYVEPAAPALSGVEGPELPEGWVCGNTGNLFAVSVGGTPSRSKPEYWNGNIHWVSSGEVAFCRIKDTREKITALGLANSNAKLNPPGTVLLAMIGEGKTRGQSAILDVPAANNQNVAAILCSETTIMPEWVFYWFMARYEQTRKGGVASGGMQPALNSQKVQALLIALPPLTEQRRIVAEVERRLSLVVALEREVEAALARAARLRQSILKRAFEGRLVPQDPNDEPAAVLLERIRAAREAPATGGKKRRTRQMPLPMM